jgi:AraC-like DNA-binding protein
MKAMEWVNNSPPWLEGSNGAEPSDIKRARRFIHDHFADKISLPMAAGAAGISPGHLSEKFKGITGLNFVEYVRRIRFREACRRLAESEKRISEIAFAVGFQSLSQFNRVFKQLSGRSPSAYRRSIQKAGAGAGFDCRAA